MHLGRIGRSGLWICAPAVRRAADASRAPPGLAFCSCGAAAGAAPLPASPPAGACAAARLAKPTTAAMATVANSVFFIIILLWSSLVSSRNFRRAKSLPPGLEGASTPPPTRPGHRRSGFAQSLCCNCIRRPAGRNCIMVRRVVAQTVTQFLADFGGEEPMDWNRLEGNWKEAKGRIKQKWGQLTDDDLTAGERPARPARRQNPAALRIGQGHGAQERRRLAESPAVTTVCTNASRG